jgi:hypothetical protein
VRQNNIAAGVCQRCHGVQEGEGEGERERERKRECVRERESIIRGQEQDMPFKVVAPVT